MRKENTFISTIEIGFYDNAKEIEYQANVCEEIVQSFVDELGECVKITPVRFIYTGGSENGASIQFIQYPRFPRKESEILDRTFLLANKLMIALHQQRCSIITKETTYLLENESSIFTSFPSGSIKVTVKRTFGLVSPRIKIDSPGS